MKRRIKKVQLNNRIYDLQKVKISRNYDSLAR